MHFDFRLNGIIDTHSKTSEPISPQMGMHEADTGFFIAQRKVSNGANVAKLGFVSSDRLLSNVSGAGVHAEGRNHSSSYQNNWLRLPQGALADPTNHRHHNIPVGSWQPPEFTTYRPYGTGLTHPHTIRSHYSPGEMPYNLPYHPQVDIGQIPQIQQPLPYYSRHYAPYTSPFTTPGNYRSPFTTGDGQAKPISENGQGSQLSGQNHPFAPSDVAKTARDYGVDQAAHGDCWFESSLAGLAHSPTGPEAISKMITKTANGYIVTFPGDRGHPVTVTEADMEGDHLKDKALWAKVTEAAIIKHNPYEAEHGGNPAKAIALLTGESTSVQYSKDVSGADLARKLAQGPVVASTPKKDSQMVGRIDHASKSDATVPNHAYTVVGYDQKTGMVTVRNPWGHNNGTAVGVVGETHDGITNQGNGVMTMSYGTFQRKFSTVSFV
jgi:hypothetical protein